MKSKGFATATVRWLRIVAVCAVLTGAVANSLFSQTIRGIASFYSKRWTGRLTSSGMPLHHDSMTCAHRTLPFGTLLKVTVDRTGRYVVVRVNDRGPYARGRILDLSWGAAHKIGITQTGIARVTAEVITPEEARQLEVKDTLSRWIYSWPWVEVE